MEYRQHHDFNVSEIGVGCYALSGVYGKKDIPAFKAMLTRAYELGVNFFDTAEAYGDAERILGETVKPFRKDIYIATKAGSGEGTKPSLNQQSVRAACERSLKLLDTDYIDLYQVHFDDPDTPVEETLVALESLVKEGKIRRYGVGHLPAERIEVYLRQGQVFSILMELSAVERSARSKLLPLCHKYGAAALAFSVTGCGLLTGRFSQLASFAFMLLIGLFLQ